MDDLLFVAFNKICCVRHIDKDLWNMYFKLELCCLLLNLKNKWLLSTLCGSIQVKLLYLMNITTDVLLFFFSVFIGSWQTNVKAAYRHIHCVNAALTKSTKEIIFV